MGIFFDTFHNKIKEVWNIAVQLDKPVSDNLSWTLGLIKGYSDFQDLQAHGAALMASIIINEKVVPRIICAWDTPFASTTTQRDLKQRRRVYPVYLLELFNGFSKRFLKRSTVRCNFFENRYVSLHRSGWSVNPSASKLGIGYRAKYLGMNYVQTPHAILSDIDTICANECIDYIQGEIDKDPNTFCLTNHYDDTNVSVGLVVFNMKKYREIYLPRCHQVFWKLPRGDSKHIQFIKSEFPEHQQDLDLRLMDKNVVNTEKYYYYKPRKNNWVDEKSVHYHAWKGEMRQNPKEFIKFYNGILDNLIQRGLNGN